MKVIKMPNIKAIKCPACGCEYEYELGDELAKENKRNYWGDIPDAFLYFLECPVCGRGNELCFDEDPEQTAIEWKKQIVKEIQKLQAENAELRAKLDNAGNFPCKVGDTIYQTDTNGTRIVKSTVKNIIFETDGVAFDERAIGESIFLTEEAVKEKMKELQGGEKQ